MHFFLPVRQWRLRVYRSAKTGSYGHIARPGGEMRAADAFLRRVFRARARRAA